MRFTTERDTLTAAIETVAPAVVGSHQTCMMVRLEVGDDLKVQATNYESMIEASCPAGLLAEPGAVLTPHAVLAKLCPKLPAGPVEVWTDEFGVQISAKGFAGTLGSADPGLWPGWNAQEASNPVEITAEGAEMLRKMLKSAAKDDKRPSLMGVHLGSGQIEATDSERWSRAVLPGLPEGPGIIIPAKFLAGLLRTATSFTLTYNDGQVYASSEGTTWASTVIAEQYPDTKPFVKAAVAHRATLPTAPLLEAIDRLSAIAVDEYDPLVLRSDGDLLTLALKSDRGEVVQDLDAVHDLPDGWAQGLNPGRFTDAVKSIGLDEVEIQFSSPMGPVRIEDGEHIQLMVPRDVNQREKQRAEARAEAALKEQAKR